jgi:hypothetical protein
MEDNSLATARIVSDHEKEQTQKEIADALRRITWVLAITGAWIVIGITHYLTR